MFTIEQIELAHSKIKSGVEFPKFIQEIKEIGVTAFVTYVKDSHTEYFGNNNFQTRSQAMYNELKIEDNCERDRFIEYLKIHQKGKTDYFSFCKHCAETGIEKWMVDLN
jgi:uncharacterized protein YbcV (DUF1398 family)